MKKILSVILSAIILLGLTACGKDKVTVDGQDLVKAAQEAYVALDSARLVVKDIDTGEVSQEFTFKYYDDVLHYVYESTVDGKEYYEYNDGKTLQIKKTGEVKSYKWPSKNFTKFKRKNPHPNASTGIFFFEPDCIGNASVTIDAEKNTTVAYSYDMAKLSKKMTTETTEGKMYAFDTTFVFDKDGKFLKLNEASSFEKDTEKTKHIYTIEVEDENGISEIQNPIK